MNKSMDHENEAAHIYIYIPRRSKYRINGYLGYGQ